MAVGYRSSLALPLGLGVPNAPAAATVGFRSLFWWMGGLSGEAAPVVTDEPRRTGAGGSHNRRARYWKGKYAGYYNDIEWTEWLLAHLSAEVVDEPAPQEEIKPAKASRIVVEPEAYATKVYTENVSALLDLKLEYVMALAGQRQSAKVAALAEAALHKKRRDEDEDDIETLFLLH